MLNCSNLLVALVVAYVAIVVYQLYKLTNPLAGITVTEPGIKPLWEEGQRYDIMCFLNQKPTLKNINLQSLMSKNQILFHQEGLVHKSNQQQVSLPVLIKSKRSSIGNGTIVSRDIFQRIQSNSSDVFLHVIVKLQGYSFADVEPNSLSSSNTPGWWLHGSVRMIKHDVIPRSFRYRYLLSDFGLVNHSFVEESRLKLPANTIISYWKPEVSVHMVADFATYPLNIVPDAVAKNVVVRKLPGQSSQSATTQKELFYRPSMYVDETGLTSDKYIHLNETVEELPLTISIGPMSSQRWLLSAILEEALMAQKQLGFSDKDIDDIRHMITETSVSFLLMTMIASVLHLLFEFLAFRSDVNFWKDNKSLAGLSTRTLITDLISQFIVFLYLVESDASLLVIIPSAIAIAIQLWKAKRATGLFFQLGGPYLVKITFSRWQEITASSQEITDKALAIAASSIDNTIEPATNLSTETSEATSKETLSNTTLGDHAVEVDDTEETKLVCATLEADRIATQYLGGLLFPCVVAYTLRSLLYQRHLSWYAWAISSLTSCVYTFGFVLMCPQLYINYQLKSVSHLPWQYLIYKFLNTFVDDLFAFIIKMPMMHRISVFRDDIVFFIYLYQRWIYRVDKNRPSEK